MINQLFRVLDHGHVVLLDYMGSDADIAAAARTSYAGGTKQVRDDRKLIRYLMRHRHTTPFEMADLKFHVKLPIFVERQWIRHRTFSTNEVSARYSVLPEEAYHPADDRIVHQSTQNKQGSGLQADPVLVRCLHDSLSESYSESFSAYHYAIDCNVAREIARLPLPVATYTEKVWMGNLHNLFHFLELRLDEHAQWEIRQYAQAIAKIVEKLFPLSWEAFIDYRLEAVTFSKQEMACLLAHMMGAGADFRGMTEREKEEFNQKTKGLVLKWRSQQ